MRSSVIVFALAACNITNLHEPIGVIGKGLTPEFEANLADAAQCWNLQLGVPFVTGDAATQVEQQVIVQFDETTCLVAAAQTQGGWPGNVDICPEQYWPGLGGPYNGALISPFRVLSHELGHVSNIVGHPDESYAVMRSGGKDFAPMFAQVDLQMFAEFNGGFTSSSPCNQVIRSYEPGTNLTVSHCACDTGPLDLDQPVAIVPSPQVTPDYLAQLAPAAQCWNLRYGLQLAVRDPLPGDQVMYLEMLPSTIGPVGRTMDGTSALAGVDNDPINSDGVDVIRQLLGVPAPVMTTSLFDTTSFNSVYPRQHDVCPNISFDSTTDECSCP